MRQSIGPQIFSNAAMPVLIGDGSTLTAEQANELWTSRVRIVRRDGEMVETCFPSALATVSAERPNLCLGLMRQLLATGADILGPYTTNEPACVSTRTILLDAIQSGCADLACLLLGAGADPWETMRLDTLEEGDEIAPPANAWDLLKVRTGEGNERIQNALNVHLSKEARNRVSSILGEAGFTVRIASCR